MTLLWVAGAPGSQTHAQGLPPAAMGGLPMAPLMQAPPPKKPAVPDWVREELLKRGLQSDGSGGTHPCMSPPYLPTQPTLCGAACAALCCLHAA